LARIESLTPDTEDIRRYPTVSARDCRSRRTGIDDDGHLAHGDYSRLLLQQVQTVGIVAISLALIVLIYLAAEPINRLLGKGGLNVISRVMGLILSSIAVTNGIVAIKLNLGLG